MQNSSLHVSPMIILLCAFIISACSVAPRYKSGARTPPHWERKGTPQEVEEGIASYYGKKYHGKPTASGEIFDMYQISAAHQLLPLGTIVKVTNLDNNRSLEVRINDRGPFVEGRIIDLSYAAAEQLGMVIPGTARVRVEVLKWGEM